MLRGQHQVSCGQLFRGLQARRSRPRLMESQTSQARVFWSVSTTARIPRAPHLKRVAVLLRHRHARVGGADVCEHQGRRDLARQPAWQHKVWP